MNIILANDAYRQWLTEIKTTIRARQIKAALAVNAELIRLYWDIGKNIVTQQENHKWGSKLIPQLSKDLKAEFPDLDGFSKVNLYYMRRFYLFYQPFAVSILPDGQIIHQPGEQFGLEINQEILERVPWRHHVEILEKKIVPKSAIFYVLQTIEHNWSRSVLSLQIDSDLYERQGKAISNFAKTLPQPQSDLEYVGKMNFYLSIADKVIKVEGDLPTMGIIMCKTKDKLEVEFALQDVHKPIGVSEYKYSELPIDIQALMPTIEELEQEIFPKHNFQDDEA